MIQYSSLGHIFPPSRVPSCTLTKITEAKSKPHYDSNRDTIDLFPFSACSDVKSHSHQTLPSSGYLYSRYLPDLTISHLQFPCPYIHELSSFLLSTSPKLKSTLLVRNSFNLNIRPQRQLIDSNTTTQQPR